MTRPTTKSDLIAAANEQFEKMWTLIDAMTDDERKATFDFTGSPNQKEAHWKRDKNIRDVFVHLYEWHRLLLSWVKANENGEAKPFLPEPYNWKTYGGMNVGFWEKHQSTTYPDAKKMLIGSHGEVLDLIGRFSNKELFTKRHFNWTGSTALGSYCVSATASHYDWAIKKLRMHRKTYRK